MVNFRYRGGLTLAYFAARPSVQRTDARAREEGSTVFLQLIVNGLLLGGIYVLVALSFSLNMGILKVLNLATPQIFLVGSLVGLDLLNYGIPFVLSLLGAIAAGGLIALVLEFVGYRTVDKTDPVLTLLTTVAFGLILENIAEHRWGSQAQFFPASDLNAELTIGPVSLALIQLISFGVAIILVAGLASILRSTSLGRSLRAVAQNRDAARVLGLKVRRAEIATFLISGLLAGGAGLLLGLNYGVISLEFGITIGISGIAAMILGGVDNLWGAVLAGPILGITTVLGTSYLGANYSNLLVFGLLAVTLVVRPEGLLGKSDQLLRRV